MQLSRVKLLCPSKLYCRTIPQTSEITMIPPLPALTPPLLPHAVTVLYTPPPSTPIEVDPSTETRTTPPCVPLKSPQQQLFFIVEGELRSTSTMTRSCCYCRFLSIIARTSRCTEVLTSYSKIFEKPLSKMYLPTRSCDNQKRRWRSFLTSFDACYAKSVIATVWTSARPASMRRSKI